MGYVFLFLVGFGMAVTGGVTMIAYMNFLPAGLSWIDYIVFVAGRVECYFLPVGVSLMLITLQRYPK